MNDDRWGGYLPWFLRSSDLPGLANFSIFFQRVSQRLRRYFRFNEAGLSNLLHFGEWLESESLQRFTFKVDEPLDRQLERYFSADAITKEVRERLIQDPEEKTLAMLQLRQSLESLGEMAAQFEHKKRRIEPTPEAKKRKSTSSQDIAQAEKITRATRDKRFQIHFRAAVVERLTVLESLLHILPTESGWYPKLLKDLRRDLVEARVALDIKGDPPFLVPLDESLLQREVIEPVLNRLTGKYPLRAQEFLNTYHDLVTGKNLDCVFSEAFKTLEALARSLSGEKSFVFDRKHLQRHFGNLHGTIQETIIRLAAHRGDEASHGRSAPDLHEMRYLLFSIFNVALLLLDYPMV
jgi:hypothetical protein